MSRPALDRAEILRRSRELRARRRKRRLYALISLPVVLLIALVALAHWDRLLLSSVSVQGAQTMTADELKETVLQSLAGRHVSLFPRRNIWLWPREAIEQHLLRTYPALERVDLRRVEQSLIITVEERLAEYLWCGGVEDSFCLFLDHGGFAFDQAPEFSGHPFFEIIDPSTLPVIGASPLNPKDFQSLLSLWHQLSRVLRDSVIAAKPTAVYLVEASEFSFQLGAARVLVARGSNPEILARDLQAVLSSETFISKYKQDIAAGHGLEYLDLRADGKIFYKFGTWASDGS